MFASRQAIVIGPTPPGTGVIAPATSADAGEVDVADQPRLAVRPAHPVDPDVDHRRPRLDPVGPDHARAARPRRPGCRRARRPPAGRGCANAPSVTVQFSRSSSCAIGLPTMFDRPITTASSPARSPSRSRSSIRQPSGVQGTIAGCPVASRPTLIDVEAVDVLLRRHRVEHPRRVDLRRQRQLHQDAVDRRVAVQPARPAPSTSASGVAASSRCSSECIPASTVCRPLLRT